ncbi:MAG: restriction endonuclease [Atopobium sp.]|nr:restriction endonuclease [Atopobium sp.]
MNDEVERPYDDTDPEDIFRYSQELISKTFVDVLATVFKDDQLKEKISYYNNPKGKGSLGNLLEEHYFLYKPNSSPEPDFINAGIELKATPYESTKKGIKAGERLVISMIPNTEPIEIEFSNSHLEKKLSKILMIWYHRVKNQKRTEHRIEYTFLFDLYDKRFAKDLKIILEDYKTIVNKIISGNAHDLSEGDTKYLGACTKGASAKTSYKPQFYNKDVLAKRRAFSLKQQYMSYILENYVQPSSMAYDSIFTEDELNNGNFDTMVISKINSYIGKDTDELCRLFRVIKDTKPKQINKILVNRMLGVNTDNSEEFQKANIKIKTIRVGKDNSIKENMSFHNISICNFVNQDFENSKEYEFFESTRFLFVVFKENDLGKFILTGAKFWNMPIEELEKTGKDEWELYKKKLLEGVNFKHSTDKNGKVKTENDLPKMSDTQMFHLRPRAEKSAYLINGKRYGGGTESDMDLLPNGDKMTKQCFWLNHKYVLKIIEDILS